VEIPTRLLARLGGSPNLPLVGLSISLCPAKVFHLSSSLLSLSAHTQIQAITLCSKSIKGISRDSSFTSLTLARSFTFFSNLHYLTHWSLIFQYRHHGVSQTFNNYQDFIIKMMKGLNIP
jgi:hypothetical protein